MRIIVEMPDQTNRLLDAIGEQQQSCAAVIREAIRQYLEHVQVKDSSSAFGLWGRRKVDGLAYQQEIRSD